MVLTSVPSTTLLVVAEQDRADFGLFEVQRDAEEAAGEVDHLIEHHVAEAFDVGDAVADFADDADVGLASWWS